ncbi:MAG: hypothetical protein DRJ03_26695 [Chloroflexi bacterium]|nr:MAG: hypothetical protein DRJ03_26695 [Chloroflexota bacterium]
MTINPKSVAIVDSENVFYSFKSSNYNNPYEYYYAISRSLKILGINEVIIPIPQNNPKVCKYMGLFSKFLRKFGIKVTTIEVIGSQNKDDRLDTEIERIALELSPNSNIIIISNDKDFLTEYKGSYIKDNNVYLLLTSRRSSSSFLRSTYFSNRVLKLWNILKKPWNYKNFFSDKYA